MLKNLFTLTLLGLLACTSQTFASVEGEINLILKQTEAPSGVVFEIVEGDEASLEWAIPQVKKQAERLRKRFPGLDIAVVSHGKEQFALETSKQENYQSVHQSVKQLTTQEDIPVHVCGTHASWYGKTEGDFPDYVDVVPAGPVQIRQYEDLGFILVTLEKPRK
jgi:intracellular sulfur oxidation DsrE/DsrF family protein